MPASTAAPAKLTYRCEAHGKGILCNSRGRVSRKEAGRLIRSWMADDCFYTIRIRGEGGIIVELCTRGGEWVAYKGRVEGVQQAA